MPRLWESHRFHGVCLQGQKEQLREPWRPQPSRAVQPTELRGGDDDPIVPLVNARILAHLIRNARLDVMRDGGHLVVVERADGIAGLVSEFLS